MSIILPEISESQEKYSMKNAAMINASGKYLKVILSVVVNAILARILSAEDYGIVSIITVFSTFFITFSDMGFGAAIIQRKDLTENEISDIFSLTVYISFALMLIFAVVSFPIALFYKDRVYISLGILLSVSLLFSALNMVPNGILNRDKKFVSIAVRTVVVYAGAAIVTVALALLGFRYYALVIQSILTSFLTFVWNYKTTRPVFHLRFNKASIQKVMNYSGFQFAFNVVNYFSRNLDNLLTGKFMGNAELGYYNKAYTLMLYPVNNLAGVVSPVLHPLLSDYQNEKNIIYKKYMKVVKLLGCIGIFVAPYCYLAANEIVHILYGSGWNQSVACFRLLSIAIVTQIINASAGGVFQAIGNTKLLFINSCINTVITIIAIFIGVFVGGNIEFLSGCVAVAYLCHFFTAIVMLIKIGFKSSLLIFFKELLPEITVLVGMVCSVITYPVSIGNIFVSAIVKFGYLGIIYLGFMIITKEIKIFKELIRKR